MNGIKPWYTSKTVLASLVAVASLILSAFGYTLDNGAQVAVTDILLQIVGIAASVIAIGGRLTATKQLA